VDRPEVRYAWNGDIALAYQVFGDGPLDLIYLQGYCSQLDLSWESPYLASFLRGLGSHARVIATDRRGWGLSDRFSPGDVPPIETLVDDLQTVMEAARSERAVVFASWECGTLAMLFAATHPDRIAGLILCDSFPTFVFTEDTPSMFTRVQLRDACEEIRRDWGTTRFNPTFEPEGIRDPAEADWFARYARASVTPSGLIAETWRMVDLDARAVLPSIHAPTLVVALRSGPGMTDPALGRLLADRIPNARLVQVGDANDPTDIGWMHWYGRADRILQEISALLNEVRDEQASFDRVLTTVLFTDIVASTERAAEVGDREWHGLLEAHHAAVRSLLARYRGKELDTAGDGFFATFDGPARAIRCAHAIARTVRPLGLEIRAGLHTGEVEPINGKVAGIAVSIGARVGAMAGPSEVLVSQTVKDLVAGSGLTFDDVGEHELKGVPGRWRVFRVVDQPAAAST
jgi:class 3 adenylate cyclase